MPWNARTRVHEYGGTSYLPVPAGFIFANFADQRLYLMAPGAPDPVPMTAAPTAALADRFAYNRMIPTMRWERITPAAEEAAPGLLARDNGGRQIAAGRVSRARRALRRGHLLQGGVIPFMRA